MERAAWISDCGKYRYWLTRQWDAMLPVLGWIMLNPSTADHQIDDRTIRECIGWGKRLGFGSIMVVNLFSMRSTDPKKLYKVFDPIGPKTADCIDMAMQTCAMVICAWGKHGRLHNRAIQVMSTLRTYPTKVCALKLNEDGSPHHPLYIPHNTAPVAYA